MKQEFIPYEEALALKELGFDEGCLANYIQPDKRDGDIIILEIWNDEDTEYRPVSEIKAPLHQQAFRWFREKYNFDLNWKPMSMVGITCYYDIEIYHPKYVWDEPLKVTGKTYEEAELECLKKLIEIVKNK